MRPVSPWIDPLDPTEVEAARPYLAGPGAARLRRTVVFATAAVSIVPLLIISFLYYDQYERSLRTGTSRPCHAR